jgi:uncharacterized protein (TIGR03000 family)
MVRASYKYLALCVAAAALSILGATRADACGGCNNCGCGTNGSTSAYGTTSAYGSYGAYPYAAGTYAAAPAAGGYGYGSNYGSYGYAASNGGNCCQSGCGGCRRHRCCNSSCGCGTGMVSSGCGCGCGTTIVPGQVIPGAPLPAPGLTPTPTLAPPAPKSTYLNRPDAGLIRISVAEGAKVFINGYETKSTGTLRQYMAYGMIPGYAHFNEIRAVLVRNGQTLVETRTVTLAAGQETGVTISFAAPKAETNMTLAKQ